MPPWTSAANRQWRGVPEEIYRTSGFRGEAIALEVADTKKVAPIALAISIEFAHNEACALLFCEGWYNYQEIPHQWL